MACPMAHRLAREQRRNMQSMGSAPPGSRGPGRLSLQKAALSEGHRLQALEQKWYTCTASCSKAVQSVYDHVLIDCHAMTTYLSEGSCVL